MVLVWKRRVSGNISIKRTKLMWKGGICYLDNFSTSISNYPALAMRPYINYRGRKYTSSAGVLRKSSSWMWIYKSLIPAMRCKDLHESHITENSCNVKYRGENASSIYFWKNKGCIKELYIMLLVLGCSSEQDMVCIQELYFYMMESRNMGYNSCATGNCMTFRWH